MKSEETKERIIKETTSLIENSNDINEITIRKIAAKANVGIGLINHYFMTKEHLIELCVQNMINEVVQAFDSDGQSQENCEDIEHSAIRIMDFLMEHPQLAKISILGDFQAPDVNDNTWGTIKGLAGRSNAGIYKAYLIVAVIQSAFLKRNTLKDYLGIDFDEKKQRDEYLHQIIQNIMEGNGYSYEISCNEWKST